MFSYHTIALISHTSKIMLKILQARLQQYVNCDLPDPRIKPSPPVSPALAGRFFTTASPGKPCKTLV